MNSLYKENDTYKVGFGHSRNPGSGVAWLGALPRHAPGNVAQKGVECFNTTALQSQNPYIVVLVDGDGLLVSFSSSGVHRIAHRDKIFNSWLSFKMLGYDRASKVAKRLPMLSVPLSPDSGPTRAKIHRLSPRSSPILPVSPVR